MFGLQYYWSRTQANEGGCYQCGAPNLSILCIDVEGPSEPSFIPCQMLGYSPNSFHNFILFLAINFIQHLRCQKTVHNYRLLLTNSHIVTVNELSYILVSSLEFKVI